ncbi:MAG: nicotinate-nucleotide adenylyltransferase [Xanthobacteraceae bacterium]|nr:nicotinate-nucleotide adenylyltransferase [Xanthobacteraceae bacterium]QYK46716.1 MAG: nicotinate-nucleotide adenylyltransferase [Xanthobacteraceae bacterium]
MRIGLLGGSFNPAHEAHRALSLLAWKRLGLDRVWWLVSPGNPLKENAALPPVEQRIEQARAVAASPYIDVCAPEVAYRTRYTFDTLKRLAAEHPRVRFVWLMGADNLAQFHRWKRWQEIARMMPFAVIERPGDEDAPLSSKASHALARYRMDESDAALLMSMQPPAWIYLHGLKSPLSSTSLRMKGTRQG